MSLQKLAMLSAALRLGPGPLLVPLQILSGALQDLAITAQEPDTVVRRPAATVLNVVFCSARKHRHLVSRQGTSRRST